MPTFRVRPGFRHGAGKVYGPGDVVTLSEAEAAGFRDKLEMVAEPQAPVVDETPTPQAEEDTPAEPEEDGAAEAAETPKRRARK